MNSFGHKFRISLFGESHASSIGVVIDGCPPGILLKGDDFKTALERRRPGKKGTTPRCEIDIPQLVNGVYRGRTTGAPILIQFANEDVRSQDYNEALLLPRPGHADLTAHQKYKGFNDPRGGGQFSGRLTAGIVAAGTVARKIIDPVKVTANLAEAGGQTDIDAAVSEAIARKDSIGGIIECRASQIPVGLGEPFFNSIESMLSHLLFSIPGVRGIEFGSGFTAASMTGSEHNDRILNVSGETASNHSGGVNGGISNGGDIDLRVAVKPTPTIGKSQETVDLQTGKSSVLRYQGRHDTCFALRCPVIIESAVAIALADLKLCC